jgi:hypothetical protein
MYVLGGVALSLLRQEQALPLHGQAFTISGENGPQTLSDRPEKRTCLWRAPPAKYFSLSTQVDLLHSCRKSQCVDKKHPYLHSTPHVFTHQGLHERDASPAMSYVPSMARRVSDPRLLLLHEGRFLTGIHTYTYFI